MTHPIPQFELDFLWAIEDGELAKIKSLLEAYPQLHTSLNDGGRPRLSEVVKSKHDEVFEYLLTVGYDLNAVGIPPYGSDTALQMAISKNLFERTKHLLEAGASPNVERPVIAAMKVDFPPQRQIEFIELLIAYGANLNRLYPLYGDETRSFSALDWAPNEPLQTFLLEKGALASKVIKHLKATGQPIPSPSA